MRKIFQRVLACLISSLFLSSQTYAQSSSYFGNQKSDQIQAGSEFISGNQPGTVLMRVNLWGAVNRPGIHNIPVKTDLMTLLSYAGGPKPDALLDDVTIKREIGNTRKLITVDVDELIHGVSHHNVELAPNDIIVIPNDEPLIDKDTLAVVTMVSVILSTLLAAAYIDRAQSR